MSLRKSPRITPAMLAANRSNALRSTGPRTAAGKQAMRFNALKHGGYAAPSNHCTVMRRLGEDPRVFERFKQEIAAALGPEGATSPLQVEYVAREYWRRERLKLLKRAAKARVRPVPLPVEKPQIDPETAGLAVAVA